MKTLKNKIAILTLLIFAISCKKVDSETNNLQSKAIFTCKIDGQDYKFESQAVMTNTQTGMQTCLGENDKFQIQIVFPNTLLAGQTSTNCQALVMSQPPNVEVYKNVVSNTVTITKRTDKIVAGTFSFEVNYSKDNPKIIKVTEGRFEAEIINIKGLNELINPVLQK
jgi:hypothetical protein